MNKIVSLLLATIIFSVLFAVPFTCNVAAETTKMYETSGDFNYTLLDDGTVRIENYIGVEATVDIPTTLDGYEVTSLGEFAFYDCASLITVTVPHSVTSILGSSFNNCENLSEIKVDSDNKVYDSRENCNAIIETATNTLVVGCMNTIIPDGVTSIGESAFLGCKGLTSVTIPNGVTSVGDTAFMWCYNLEKVTIPKSATSIGEGVFTECVSLSEIKVDGDNKVYDSRENCNAIIETKTNTLMYGCMNTVIPASVKSIADYAFFSALGKGTDSITIPTSVKSIGDSAFDTSDKLYVYKGSYAHRYAKSNDLEFVVLDDAQGDTSSWEVNKILLCIAIPITLAIILSFVLILKKKRK